MFDASTSHLIEAASGLRKRDVIARHNLVGWPMVDTQAKFSKPATYGDDIDIVSEFVELGRSSFKIHHRVYHGDQLAIEAWETRVLVAADPQSPARLKSAPIPPELLAQFQG
jgi:4-hydroxybenzoyl-CoA thioesterase